MVLDEQFCDHSGSIINVGKMRESIDRLYIL